MNHKVTHKITQEVTTKNKGDSLVNLIEFLRTTPHVTEENTLISLKTGEILAEYNYVPYNHSFITYPLTPETAKSYDQLRDICKELGEKGNYSAILNLEHINSKPIRIHLFRLINLVRYRNILIMPKNTLALELGVLPSNLSRTLKRLETKGYLRISKDRTMNREDIKILLNPAYVWRGHGMIRLVKINEWYGTHGDTDHLELSTMERMAITDQCNELSNECPPFSYLYEPMEFYEAQYDPYITGRSFSVNSNLNKILSMSEERFSLWVNS